MDLLRDDAEVLGQILESHGYDPKAFAPSQFWHLTRREILEQFPKEEAELADAIFENLSFESRRDKILELVMLQETQDLELLAWVEEMLERVPQRSRIRRAARALVEELNAKPYERAAVKSLKRAFQGGSHELLYTELNSLRDECNANVHYSCYTSIVHSSGTGKSRAVLEMSRLGVYICYCSTAAAGSLACPPRTHLLADLVSDFKDELAMVLYFKAWLAVLSEEYQVREVSSVEWMEMQRDGTEIASKVHKAWNDIRLAGLGFELDILENADQRSARLLKPEMGKLEELMGLKPETKKVKFLFVFDEGHGLLPGENSKVDRSVAKVDSLFYQMRRAARAFFQHESCFAVVIDTMGFMSNMKAPRQSGDDSRKVKELGFLLFRPLFQLDTFNLITRTSDLSPEAMFRYGRPLWSSHLENADIESLVKFAETKLVKVTLGNLSGEPVDVYGSREGGVKLTASQAMALLSASVGLEICPRSILSHRLVASHMNVVAHVSGDRSTVYIAQPVEPVVSEAAATILNYRDGEAFSAALTRLEHAFLHGYVAAGDRGEMITKTLLLLACWRLFDGKFYLRRIPVRDYLQSLLGWSRKQVEEACIGLPGDSAVFFNSFMLVKAETITQEMMAAAFIRGCAIEVKAGNQVMGFDLFVPVSTSSGMTGLIVSAKQHQNRGWMAQEATVDLRPWVLDVKWTPGLKVLTLLVNVAEPNLLKREHPPSRLWRSSDLDFPEEYDKAPEHVPAAHMSLLGVERNFFGMKLASSSSADNIQVRKEQELSNVDEKVKEILLRIATSVVDLREVARRRSPKAAEGVVLLLPDRYQLQPASERDMETLSGPPSLAPSNLVPPSIPIPASPRLRGRKREKEKSLKNPPRTRAGSMTVDRCTRWLSVLIPCISLRIPHPLLAEGIASRTS